MKFTAGALSASCCTALVRAVMPRPDSDYDVAVFLRDMPDRIAELYRLADLSTAILENGGDFIHAMAYPAGFYNDERMPLMYAIRAECIDL